MRALPGIRVFPGIAGGAMKSAPSAAETLSIDMNAQSGATAVQTSGTLQQLKVAERADGSSLSRVRYVGQKTFVLKDGVWVDTAYDPRKQLPHLQIIFGSEAYFKDATQNREMAEYFSLGEKVLFVLNGKVYEVVGK